MDYTTTSTEPGIEFAYTRIKQVEVNEADFLKLFHGTFYLNAKEYFKSIYGTDTGTGGKQ